MVRAKLFAWLDSRRSIRNMSNAVRHSIVLSAMLAMTNSVAADNTELWDLYPSSFEFSQYNANVLSGSSRVNWFTFATAPEALSGVSLSITVEDGTQTVTLESPDATLFKLAAGADWQWSQIFTDGFVVDDCEIIFAVELGTVLLPAPEGYRFGQREILSWSGPPDTCQITVKNYLEKAESSPVMPLHLAAFWSVGGLDKPAATGRFEFALIQELRRSKRLLPLEKTADVDADPFRGKLRSPGTAQDRFALVQARLGGMLFADGFEQ